MNRAIDFMDHNETLMRNMFLRWLLAVAAIGFVAGVADNVRAVVVTDDFSDMNDTTGPKWTHLDKAVNSTGQTWDASTGRYRLHAPSNAVVPEAPQLDGYGFVGSYVEPSFTDVRVTADVVDFPNVGFFGSWFGVAARMNGNNDPPMPGVGLGFKGYSYQYESTADGGNGEMVLNILFGDGLKDIGSQKVTLDNTKDYRVMLEVIGDVLHGQVWELDANGAVVGVVAEDFRNVALDAEPVGNVDHDGDDATPQVPFEPYTSGFSGVYGIGHLFFGEADFTVDNFRSETAVAGDYNRNGAADAADYVLWRNTVGSTGPDANPPTPYTGFGDMRANGAITNGYTQTIDQADYDFWRQNFGKAVAAGVGSGGAVPEPATAALVLLSWIGLAVCRPQRGCR